MRGYRFCCLLIVFALFGAMLINAPVSTVRAVDPTPTVPGGITVHIVARGDTLFNIARDYGTSVEQIGALNGISDVTQIQIGQRLLIPNATPGSPGVLTQIVIAPGDTLQTLSLRFGTSHQAIAARNGVLNPARLYIGLPLILPAGSYGDNGTRTGRLYTVQPDDTLYRIALRLKVNFDQLIKLNRLRSASLIVPGQKLLIPDATAAIRDLPQGIAAVSLSPEAPEQGRTFGLQITTERAATIGGDFIGKALLVDSDPTRTTHRIVVGIPALQAPGLYSLNLIMTSDDGAQVRYQRDTWIADGGYRAETITLSPGQADLINPQVTQPELDRILTIVSQNTATNYLNAPMGLPCSAPVTSQFGTRRSYNGGAFDQVHTGTDFAALPGTSITAPAGGVVVLAGTLNVRGNATIIDHGNGVFTGYWHQDEVYVKVGDTVTAGQVIGTIGATGRVTGPHLHWELFVHGVQVDPLQWARMAF